MNAHFETELLKLLDMIPEEKHDEAWAIAEKLRNRMEKACFDPLMGLLTKQAFYEFSRKMVRKCVREKQCISVVFMDVDNLKQINADHGHLAADSALAQIGERVQACFRESDVVSRFGGDEMVALLPDTNIKEALQVALRVRDTMDHESIAMSNGQSIQITLSIGVAEVCLESKKDDAIHLAMNQSNTGMYVAKRVKNGFTRIAVVENDEIRLAA